MTGPDYWRMHLFKRFISSGVLARYIHEALDRKGPEALVLVDRSNVRKKSDSFIRSSEKVDLERCLVDIKDFDLGRVATLKRHPRKPIIIVGKHVCGTATDLTLQCAMHAVKQGLPVQAILIALCCHHRCRWTQYCNQSWMSRQGIDGFQFEIMSSMSTWAICGQRKSCSTRAHFYSEDQHLRSETTKNHLSDKLSRSSLGVEERESMGRICKRIIDQGRLEYLSSHGFDTELVYYVDSEVSLENTALFARRDKWLK
jgi:tRNA:m4X modification enzyme